MLRTPRALAQRSTSSHPHLNFGFDPNFDTFLSLSDGRRRRGIFGVLEAVITILKITYHEPKTRTKINSRKTCSEKKDGVVGSCPGEINYE